jgi:hypothetical protein
VSDPLIGDRATFVSSGRSTISLQTEATIRIGVPRLLAGIGVDAASLPPRYLGQAQAEVTRTALRFEDDEAI